MSSSEWTVWRTRFVLFARVSKPLNQINRRACPQTERKRIMKKTSVLVLSLSLTVLANVISVVGQERQATFEKQIGPVLTMQGPDGAGNTFTFVNSEFSFDRLVKGAPHSAQAITEMTQMLSDGNRIVNTTSAAVYRDGEGRTRREQTLKAIGGFSAAGESFKTISINDPVAGVAYVL